MGKIISIVNYKGGVGKTAVTFNLGAALHRKGKSVLLVDLDPQAALTFAVMGRKSEDVESTVLDFFDGVMPEAVVIEKGFELFPSKFELDFIETAPIPGKDVIIQNALRRLKGHDFILIDTPPAINIFTVMAVLAGHSAYIVIGSDIMSYRALLAFEDVIRETKPQVKKRVIVNLFDQRRNVEKDLLKELREIYSDTIFKATIRRSVLIPESFLLSRTIFRHRKNSPVATDFEALAREVIKREGAK